MPGESLFSSSNAGEGIGGRVGIYEEYLRGKGEAALVHIEGWGEYLISRIVKVGEIWYDESVGKKCWCFVMHTREIVETFEFPDEGEAAKVRGEILGAIEGYWRGR